MKHHTGVPPNALNNRQKLVNSFFFRCCLTPGYFYNIYVSWPADLLDPLLWMLRCCSWISGF